MELSSELEHRSPSPSVVNRQSSIVNSHAFSLIEIIVAVGLLSVIMIGLLMMFNQTQRVFRSSLTQVDVLESGRVAASLLAGELEQIAPSDQPAAKNFFVGLVNGTPLIQPLPGNGNARRTNLLEDVFLLTRENQTWRGIGYFVRTEDQNKLLFPGDSGTQQILAGGLYRFEESLSASDGAAPYVLYNDFFNQARPGAWATNTATTSRVVDGVVHFKLRAFDPDGYWITTNVLTSTATNSVANIVARWFAGVGEVGVYTFSNNAVPASVEFELGLLEDRVWQRYNSFPAVNATARYNYLTNQVGRVHIFRQRVAIRDVDPAAYQ